MINEEWALVDEQGQSIVSFTSFFDIDYKNEGKALSNPVEEGGFANYNKTQSPLDIRVTLGFQGDESDFQYALSKLAEYQQQTVKLSVATPAEFYESMTLESYTYKRAQGAGAGMLTVELNFKEVREVETQVSTTVITKPKNSTSSGNVNTGKTQAQEPSDGLLVDLGILEGRRSK